MSLPSVRHSTTITNDINAEAEKMKPSWNEMFIVVRTTTSYRLFVPGIVWLYQWSWYSNVVTGYYWLLCSGYRLDSLLAVCRDREIERSSQCICIAVKLYPECIAVCCTVRGFIWLSWAIIQLITVIILHLIITTRTATTRVYQATETNTERVEGLELTTFHFHGVW